MLQYFRGLQNRFLFIQNLIQDPAVGVGVHDHGPEDDRGMCVIRMDFQAGAGHKTFAGFPLDAL
jgi:hypothetical protein